MSLEFFFDHFYSCITPICHVCHLCSWNLSISHFYYFKIPVWNFHFRFWHFHSCKFLYVTSFLHCSYLSLHFCHVHSYHVDCFHILIVLPIHSWCFHPFSSRFIHPFHLHPFFLPPYSFIHSWLFHFFLAQPFIGCVLSFLRDIFASPALIRSSHTNEVQACHVHSFMTASFIHSCCNLSFLPSPFIPSIYMHSSHLYSFLPDSLIPLTFIHACHNHSSMCLVHSCCDHSCQNSFLGLLSLFPATLLVGKITW